MSNCDFCFTPDPEWEFPAETFVDPLLQSRSLGAWLACGECAAYLCRNDYEGLARERAIHNPTVKTLVGLIGAIAAREEILKMWAHFAKHRIGEPRRIKEKV